LSQSPQHCHSALVARFQRLEGAVLAERVLVGQVYDAAADRTMAHEAWPGVSLRCLAYALPLSLLGWTIIFLSIAAAAGYLKL
jgi:hypothetical protein